MKKFLTALFTIFIFTGFLTAATTGCGKNDAVDTADKTSELKIEMLDIGQGDAVLIRSAKETVLVDTGDIDERDHLVQLLRGRDISVIDKLIITHPHADHIGGAYAVFKNFDVKEVYDNGDPTTTKTYTTYLKNIKQKNIAYKQLKAGDEVNIGTDVNLKVFSPSEKMVDTDDDLNNNSLVFQLRYKNFTMLFTGDSEREAEQNILKSYGDEVRSLVLKAPHHGSKTSSSDAYLKAVGAKDVLISLGKNNEYGHPHKQVLNRYKKYGMNVYRTDTDGTITVLSDGSENYVVSKEKN